jgi:hypothetical protein
MVCQHSGVPPRWHKSPADGADATAAKHPGNWFALAQEERNLFEIEIAVMPPDTFQQLLAAIEALPSAQRAELGRRLTRGSDGRAAHDHQAPVPDFADRQAGTSAVAHPRAPMAAEALPRQPVMSSALRSVGYDPASSALHLELAGGELYEYSGVPQDVHAALLQAASLGQFFNHAIRDRFPYRKLSAGLHSEGSHYY